MRAEEVGEQADHLLGELATHIRVRAALVVGQDLVQLAWPSAERDRDDELDRLGDLPASEAAGFADGMPRVRCAVADAADARDPCRRYPDENCPKRLDDLPAGPHAAIR